MAVLLLQLSTMGVCHNECGESRCGRHGPRIRFPFRLKHIDPDHCGYPGFDLTCTHNHHTLLEFPALPLPIKLQVNYIDYTSRYISVSDPENCLPRQFLRLNHSSISPFHFLIMPDSLYFSTIYFFNCPPNKFSCPIYAAMSASSVDGAVLSSTLIFCTKLNETIPSSFGYTSLPQNELGLWWSKPNCSECEAQGKLCKLNTIGSQDVIQCFDRPPKPISKMRYVAIVTGVSVGSIVLLLHLLAFFKIYRYFRSKGEDQARLERFLQDYRALKPTRFSYADLSRITNCFRDKIGEGAHGVVFRGKLSNKILVAVKMFNNSEGDGQEFISEVGTMAKIHHVNVARMLGFCADGFHRAIVYNFFSNGSLQKYIGPPDMENFLGWERLQQITLSIAKGIEYLHYGCDNRILHFDINPRNVLLDDHFIPKITDFGLAKLCPKNQSTISVTAAKGTLGYIAPEVFSRNFGNVSYKSDIYSFGMLLLEMVGGKKNIDMSDEERCQVLYPEWIHDLIEGRDMYIQIEDEGDNRIVKKLALVGLWCIQWHPVNRPSMKTVVQMLEGEGDKLKSPPNPFDSTTSSMGTRKNTSVPQRHLIHGLEIIHEVE
ncbi:rust resistance kinase Lr10-like [Senna tora]|uniref:Rust resistance kinase Lr10-like n=1 Tax=Senna tora TaxID=362788 RepID=A0A834T7V9_9FABA|nr:rust resistance kinase Lr10-like [Senna tora]